MEYAWIKDQVSSRIQVLGFNEAYFSITNCTIGLPSDLEHFEFATTLSMSEDSGVE